MERAILRWLGTTLLGMSVACAVARATIETRLKLLHDYAVAVNEARVVRGLPPLKLNEQLCDAAQSYAETLLATGQIRHADAQGRRADYRAVAAGYFYYRLGENLAAGQLSYERALEMWLQSPPHRANLLSADYRELGVGFTANDSARYRTAWTQLLGARHHVYPVVINLDAFATESPRVAVYVHGAREAQVMRYRIGDGAWSEWQAPREWLGCQLPESEGFHTITVQLQIGARVYEASDEIYLQSRFVLAEVAGEREGDDEDRPRRFERASAGVERAARREHIVQQGDGASANQFRAHDFERILHILHALSLAQPHLRASVEAATERAREHGDA
ncbi:MAG: CAP domain-containing protein [Fimbriimonadales bacterium]|nr:CAP domain-containing protein [Fimbriimonadales bacterium]